MNEKRIAEIAKEAVKLKRENPTWSYRQAVEEARREYECVRK